MDIWDVPVGQRCRAEINGHIYMVVEHRVLHRPFNGPLNVCVARDETLGRTAKFVNGIDVEKL